MEKSYLAGFFDGEGSISITDYTKKNGRHLFQMHVQVANTNDIVLKAFLSKYGGFINPLKRRSERHTQAYVWIVRSNLAYLFLKDISDLLVIKKEQALLAIDYYENSTRKNTNRWYPLSDEEIEIRSSYASKLRKMNGRFR